MLRFGFDIETNGFLDVLDRVHCLSIKDLDTQERWSCADQPGFIPLAQGLDILNRADRVYAHNGQRFDVPALQKVYPRFNLRGELIDTMLVAQLRFAHIKREDQNKLARQTTVWKPGDFPGHLVGKHTIEAWGYRLGVQKGTFKGPWEVWTPEMQEYCDLDVDVLEALIAHLGKAGAPAGAVELEHKLNRMFSIQEANGWPFDEQRAAQLYAKLSARREEIGAELRETFGSWYEPNGKPVTPKKSMVRRKGLPAPTQITEGAPYQKLKVVEFNPASRNHIVKVLRERYGWKPEVFTENGNPKMDEAILSDLRYPEAKLLSEYFVVQKILGYVGEGDKSWLTLLRDGKLHHGCGQGPITHRVRHFHPNLGQVPSGRSAYGHECRSLFIVPEGWTMVGADVSGLELRMLAEYLAPFDGGAYRKELLEGDIHQKVADALGISRDDSKTFSYATIYGAGPAKLGGIVRPDLTDPKDVKKAGLRAQQDYMNAIPGLERLIAAVKSRVRSKGYVRLLDERRAYPRGLHSALNTLLQGSGAILTKNWYVLTWEALESNLGAPSWDGEWTMLAFVHDEIQAAFRTPELAEEAKRVAVEKIAEAGRVLNVVTPMTGEARTGTDWSETH